MAHAGQAAGGSQSVFCEGRQVRSPGAGPASPDRRLAFHGPALQLELSAVQPVAPPTDVVAERARLVFTVLEVGIIRVVCGCDCWDTHERIRRLYAELILKLPK